VKIPEIDLDAIVRDTVELCRIPSPTGFTDEAMGWVEERLRALDLPVLRTEKGSLVASLGGESGPGRMLSAHVDTLGAIVKEVKPSGRLRLSSIGGYDWSTIEGEYCLVHRAGGAPVSGTVLTTKASYHVHNRELVELKRDEESIEVRLDETVGSADEVRALGIEVGDPVSFDPRAVVTETGFVKSRHLDDKACATIQIGVARAMTEARVSPPRPAHLYFSCWEEVGHGTSAGVPDGVTEVVAVDMAAVGQGQTSDERAVTICAKDSTGPYHYGLTRQLVDLAREHAVDYRVDIYPHYGSDVSQALRAGYDIRGALVGPGVDASHSFERLHRDSLRETTRLLLAYLLTP
jgi:putative aminopeptidase FrvX